MRKATDVVSDIVLWAVVGYFILTIVLMLFDDESGAPFSMRYHRRLFQACYSLSAFFGEIGLKAEAAYWQAAQGLR